MWQCPVCGYERRATGEETALRCVCSGHPFMKLVGEPKARVSQNRPVDLYVAAELLVDAPAATPEETPVPPEAATPEPQ